MNSEKVRLAISKQVPAASVEYCLGLLVQHRFEFRLRKTRITKIGDFTFRHGELPRITVNQDLDPYLFLVTYLHEIAHLEVHNHYGNRVEGHGIEWKNSFREILEPVMNDSVFPTDLLAGLRKHMVDPMATTFSDSELMKIFRKYDSRTDSQVFLADIPEGSIFGIRGRWFRKGQTKRTRVLCQELKSKRKYFVPVDSPIEDVQLALF